MRPSAEAVDHRKEPRPSPPGEAVRRGCQEPLLLLPGSFRQLPRALDGGPRPGPGFAL